MKISAAPVAASRGRLSDRAFDALAATLAFLAYFAVFLLVRSEGGVGGAALSSLINLLPLLLLAVAVRAILRRYVIGFGPVRQVAAHVLLACAFAFLWHWLLMVLVGVRTGGSLTEFAVRAFFPAPVIAWQLLQGVTVYALIASLSYLRMQPELPDFLISVPGSGEPKEPALDRYFIRRGDDIYPVDVSQIVSITGADDYAEVATLEGRHLVRTTLAEFEVSLDPANFLRVHRSRIVNLQRVIRVEPSGDGRMLLHMQNKETIQTSRAGAKLVRGRVF